MSDKNPALLRTKLFVVRPQPNLVRRDRAAALMESLTRRKLTLISAPPGFGKTTLVSAWIARSGFSAAWVSLDDTDNDPATFLAYLVEAIRTLHPNVGEFARAAARTSPMPPLETSLAALINDILSVDGEFVLVLDDYHVIDNPAIHEGLLYLIEHAPPQIHCIVTTRVDPPMPLARLRVRGQLLEIRAADLRFSVDEAGQYFNQQVGVQLSRESLERLQQKTEGWVAGLQMAALSLHNRDDVESFIEAFTGADRYIIDFLLEEVIRRQPEDIQQAMVKLSILDRFTAQLAEAVTGYPDGTALLATMERSNLFLISLDNRREWHRYHHLFADLLRHRLKDSPERMADLHHRAARWFNDAGLLRESLQHATQAGDTELLAAIIEQHWRDLSGDPKALIGTRLQHVPRERIDGSARLSVLEAWDDAFSARMDEAAAAARRALELFDADGGFADEQEANELRGQVATIRGLAARDRSESESVIEHIGLALKLIPERAPNDPGYGWVTTHGMFYSLLGDAHYSRGDVQQSLVMYERAGAHGRRVNDPRTIYVSLINIGRQLLRLGRLEAAYASLDEAEALAESVAGLITPVGLVCELKSATLYEQYRLDEAEAEALKAKGLSGHKNTGVIQINRILFDIAVARRDWERAEALLAETQGITVPGYAMRFQSVADQLSVVMGLHHGDRERLAAWDDRYFGPQSHELPQRNYFMRMYERMLRIEVLLALGRLDDAEAMLPALEQEAVERGLELYRIRILTWRAVIAAEHGDDDGAMHALEAALAPAEAERFIAPFAEARPYVTRLLALYRRRPRRRLGTRDGFLSAVCGACGLDDVVEVAEEERGGGGDIVPLTNRELEILTLLGLGLSNRQIAEKTYISLNTVKTHVANLMDKLETSNRVEALLRARELGMIE